jgi:hypothetical protein
MWVRHNALAADALPVLMGKMRAREAILLQRSPGFPFNDRGLHDR